LLGGLRQCFGPFGFLAVRQVSIRHFNNLCLKEKVRLVGSRKHNHVSRQEQPSSVGGPRYVVTFERQKTILQAIFTEREPFIKRLIARIVGFDGAYHRFTGKVTIEKFETDVRVEIFDDHALWELIYLGKARSPTL
jgi:hypothetical protein